MAIIILHTSLILLISDNLAHSFGQDFTYPENLSAYVDEYFKEETAPMRPFHSGIAPGSFQCLQLYLVYFYPIKIYSTNGHCHNGVRVVCLLAMLGNGSAVVLILLRSKMDVYRYLAAA